MVNKHIIKVPAKVSKEKERLPYNKTTITILIIVVIIVRLLFTLLPGDKYDLPVHVYYTHLMETNGIKNFYEVTKTVYGPVFMYMLLITSKICSIFSISDAGREFLIKFWVVCADFLGAYLLFLFAKGRNKQKLGFWLGIAYVLNPAMIMCSSVWGQFDSIFITLLFAVVYCFILQKQAIAVAIYTIAVLTKPQSILLLPLVLYLFLLQDFNIGNILKIFKGEFNKDAFSSYFMNKLYKKRIVFGGLYSLTAYFVINLPFYNTPNGVNTPLEWFIKFLEWFPKNTFRGVNDYPFATANGFNLWTLLGGQTNPDSQPILFLSYATWSKLLIVALWIFAIWILSIMKNEIFSIYYTSFILSVGFFMFSTRVHEKYMLPAIIFCSACLVWTNKLLLPLITLSGCIFINILYSYYVGKVGYPWFSRTDNIGYLISTISFAVFLYLIYFAIKQVKNALNSNKSKHSL